MPAADRKRLILVERLCWIAALVCLLPFGATTAARHYLAHGSDNPSMQFDGDRSATPSGFHGSPNAAKHVASDAGSGTLLPAGTATKPSTVDDGLWSPQRRSKLRNLIGRFTDTPVARLEFAGQGRVVPVFSGDSEAAMTVGAGHLTDTSPLDGSGNIAITSHRDGAFRILKDVDLGDVIVLETSGGSRRFTVSRRFVVPPDRVDVLEPTPVPTLTLITCYPFYFVGSAPDRFILQAELSAPDESRTASP